MVIGNAIKHMCYNLQLSNFSFIFISTSLPTLWVNLELISPNHADFIDNAIKIYLDYSSITKDKWQEYLVKLATHATIPLVAVEHLFGNHFSNPAVCAFVAGLWPNIAVKDVMITAIQTLNDAYDRIYRTVARGTY
jgi:hypothetical protein